MDQQQQGQGGGSKLKTIARDLINSGPEVVVGLLSEIFGQLSEAGIDPEQVVAEALGGGGGQQMQPQEQPQMQPQGQPAAGGNAEADAQAMVMAMERELAATGGGSRGRITRR